jgi:hypothetical protein
MNEFCTCGAQLPPDARFCHKCGKPQREEPLPEAYRHIISEEVPVLDLTPAPPRLPSFHNPVAVRAGLLAASLAALLNLLPVLSYGFLIWLLAAGFFSVYVYERRTGALLSVREGARMGWITGVLSFAISTVFFTLSMLALSARSGGLAGLYRERLEGLSITDQSVQEAVQMLQSPAGLTLIILGSLVFVFVIVTLMCTAGGALGAKVLDKS